MKLEKKKNKEKETTCLKNSLLSQLVSGTFHLCVKIPQPNREQERSGECRRIDVPPAPVSPNTGTPSGAKPGAAAAPSEGTGSSSWGCNTLPAALQWHRQPRYMLMLVRGTDGREHSQGWGEGGRPSHTEGKAQRGRMRKHRWDRAEGTGERCWYWLAGACWLWDGHRVLLRLFAGTFPGRLGGRTWVPAGARFRCRLL